VSRYATRAERDAFEAGRQEGRRETRVLSFREGFDAGTRMLRRSVLEARAEGRAAERALAGFRGVGRLARLLQETLADGPRPAVETETGLREAGWRREQIKRARDALGVRSSPSGFGGPRMWALPGQSPGQH
jgi:hypothetical protein